MLLKSVCCALRVLHDHADRRRHEEDLRDALRLDQLERRARIEFGHDDVGRARAQSPHAVADAADVKTRHRDETDVAIGPVVPLHVVVRRQLLQIEEATVLQLHAFRMPGRAARVHLNRDVVGRNVDAGIRGAMSIAPAREVLPLRMHPGHRDDVFDVRQLIVDLRDEAEEIRSDAQHFGAAVVEDVGHFRRREPPVDADRYRARFRRAEHELIEQVRVLVEEADTAAGTSNPRRAVRSRHDSSVRRTGDTSFGDRRSGTRLGSVVRGRETASARQACRSR